MATTIGVPVGRADGVSREEFDDLAERLSVAERSRPPVSTPPGDAFVRQDEFRLFKWVAAFAMASLVGGIGVLYQMTSELRVSVERGFGDLQVKFERELGGVNQRLGRIETRLDGVERRLDDVEARLRHRAGEGGSAR